VSLRYRRLSSGRVALIHSCYVGADYSGREGNFFAHTLVSEQGPLPRRPTGYFGWSGWQTWLAPEQDGAEAPLPLPLLDLAAVDGWAFDGREFVSSVRDGSSLLADMAAALLLVRPLRRPIVIRDLADQGWRWIACLLDLLPLATARDLTISSYEIDATNLADINATIAGGARAFDSPQQARELFLFEPATGICPKLPDTDPQLLSQARHFAVTAVSWYLQEPERLQQFHAFMGSFEPCPADRILATGLDLFERRWSPHSIDIVEYRQLAEFVTGHTRPGSWSPSINLLRELVAAQPNDVRFDEIERVVVLCTQVPPDDADGVATLAYGAWLEQLGLALQQPLPDAARIEQRWDELAARFDPTAGGALLLADDRIAALCRIIRQRVRQRSLFWRGRSRALSGWLGPTHLSVMPRCASWRGPPPPPLSRQRAWPRSSGHCRSPRTQRRCSRRSRPDRRRTGARRSAITCTIGPCTICGQPGACGGCSTISGSATCCSANTRAFSKTPTRGPLTGVTFRRQQRRSRAITAASSLSSPNGYGRCSATASAASWQGSG
jgi:GTPase-associated protein 1, N-terminal domain type 2